MYTTPEVGAFLCWAILRVMFPGGTGRNIAELSRHHLMLEHVCFTCSLELYQPAWLPLSPERGPVSRAFGPAGAAGL